MFCVLKVEHDPFPGPAWPCTPQILPTAEEIVPAFLHFIEQTVANPITYTPTQPSLGDLFARFLADN